MSASTGIVDERVESAIADVCNACSNLSPNARQLLVMLRHLYYRIDVNVLFVAGELLRPYVMGQGRCLFLSEGMWDLTLNELRDNGLVEISDQSEEIYLGPHVVEVRVSPEHDHHSVEGYTNDDKYCYLACAMLFVAAGSLCGFPDLLDHMDCLLHTALDMKQDTASTTERDTWRILRIGIRALGDAYANEGRVDYADRLYEISGFNRQTETPSGPLLETVLNPFRMTTHEPRFPWRIVFCLLNEKPHWTAQFLRKYDSIFAYVTSIFKDQSVTSASSQAHFPHDLESENATTTSDDAEAAKSEPTTADVVVKLSSDARRLFQLLSTEDCEWIDLDLFFAACSELAHHGVIGEGKAAVLSAVNELHQRHLIEFDEEGVYVDIRATPGKVSTPMWTWPNEDEYYKLGRRMLLAATQLQLRRTGIKTDVEACTKSAHQMGSEREMEMSDYVWGVLRAGLCGLVKAHVACKDYLGAQSLLILSSNYRFNRDDTAARQKSDVLHPGRVNFYSEDDVGNDDIGLYSARIWIDGV
jgi:hypothetical protein